MYSCNEVPVNWNIRRSLPLHLLTILPFHLSRSPLTFSPFCLFTFSRSPPTFSPFHDPLLPFHLSRSPPTSPRRVFGLRPPTFHFLTGSAASRNGRGSRSESTGNTIPQEIRRLEWPLRSRCAVREPAAPVHRRSRAHPPGRS